MKTRNSIIGLALITILTIPNTLVGQDQGSDEAEELAQKTQNPLADLVTIPFQNNVSFDNTQNRATGYILNIQPIFPIKAKKISFVNRLVFGLGYVPGITEGSSEIPIGYPDEGRVDGTWGTQDLNWTAWITPPPKGSISWGLGPSVTFPIASDNRLGSGKWSVDAIFRQLWSVGGDEERPDVNQFFVQPLVYYNLNKGWAIATMPVITVNWKYPEGEKLLLPVGGGINKLFYGKVPVLVMCHYYYHAVKPDLAPSQELRIQVNFIFAK